MGRRRCADFQRRWLGFVHRWQRVDRDDPARARGLVERALADGLPEPAESTATPTAAPRLRCAMAVDPARAAPSTPRATRRPTASPPVGVDPLQHFVDEGWRNLRAPSLEFDLWCYTCAYLDPTAEDVNPLLHYLLVGRHEGLEPVPGPPPRTHPDRLRRTHAAAGLPVRGLRPGRHRRRVRRALPARAEPVQRRLLPGRRRPRPRRARQARGPRAGRVEHPARAPTTSAPGRCWPATWSAGSGWTATTRWSSPTTAASWSGRSTRCSPRWTRARATGGACRRPRWSSTRTTSATTPRCRSPRPSAS